jgi:hypothetical protein
MICSVCLDLAVREAAILRYRTFGWRTVIGYYAGEYELPPSLMHAIRLRYAAIYTMVSTHNHWDRP